jgi:hypothetical protein
MRSSRVRYFKSGDAAQRVTPKQCFQDEAKGFDWIGIADRLKHEMKSRALALGATTARLRCDLHISPLDRIWRGLTRIEPVHGGAQPWAAC